MVKPDRMIIGLILVSVGVSLLSVAWALRDTRVEAKGAQKYNLLAKRIFILDHDDALINFSPLRRQLKDHFAKLGVKHSFYFEYLYTGTSIRIGENEELAAASLIKVPLVMNLYKAAELGKIDLDKKIRIKPEWIDKGFGTLWQRGAGTEISLREAADMALRESDNTAAQAIRDNLHGLLGEDEQSLYELDAPLYLGDQQQAAISAPSYGSIFKCLYFACFNNDYDSQQILDSLAKSLFTNRLVEGVPNNVKVAHKIGTYSTKTQSDCGIVYAPKRNYLFCMMVELPEEKANSEIATVSSMVYDYVIKSEKGK